MWDKLAILGVICAITAIAYDLLFSRRKSYRPWAAIMLGLVAFWLFLAASVTLWLR